MAFLRSFLFFVLISNCYFGGSIGDEEFSEELLLKPLPDRKLLAHFHFDSRTPSTKLHGHHHILVPKAIYQLVRKFRIREMELSFTQGRWNYERWGGFDPTSSSNAKPPGVELWAVFDVPPDQVDANWKNLTHTLSGLFCASINFLESSTAYSAPAWGFRPFSGSLRYGALPREAVCTENLTPWLKLLPCRDKAGLASILDRPSIYKGFYHSQRLRLLSNEFGLEEGVEPGILLEQTLTVVLQPRGQKTSTYSDGRLLQPSWSISSIFGRKVSGRCVLAKSSTVFLELESGLVSELSKLSVENGSFGIGDVAFEGSWSSPGFELSVIPDRVIKEVNGSHSESSSVMYEYSVDKLGDNGPFDVGFVWKLPVVWSCLHSPFHASRFLIGSGNQRGSIAISLISTGSDEGFMGGDLVGDGCKVRVDIFQVVPWYVKVYFHTLQVFVDGQPEVLKNIIEKMHVSPSEDRVSPGVMEMVLRFPCSMKSATIIIDFDKGFLHIDEYPPDANQGFDIPSAVISFPDFEPRMYFLEENSSSKSPMLLKLQEKNPVISYTEVLLVPLATPDFSMPYNVITITCTVFALYFGSLLNALRRRVGEEERFLKSEDQQGKLRSGWIENLHCPSSKATMVTGLHKAPCR
ncbi:GPI transamidase component PIG-T [Macleaya cordata]|uniref:GPI transamidase component PIG-T n=1 Tax=Macleaya cordata TaxID=56857 RepID=A0A200R8Q9_MACCD|nr:GPI transamidase component PIG-T [Macleaya cordata]